MSYFLFNDYNSKDDLIITKPIVRPSWAQEVNEFSTGTVSKIVQLSQTYSNTPLEVTAVIKNTSPDRLKTLYNAVRGYGKLVLSSSPDEYLNAVASVLQPAPVALSMAEIAITFNLLPFAYAKQPTIAEFTGDYTEVENRGTVFSAPEIRFTPSSAGDVELDLNGAVFTVKVPEELVNFELIVDCDAEVTYYNAVQKIPINDITYGQYPLLTTGMTTVRYRGNVSHAQINVRERFY